jgi:hypothetical protein
MVFDVESVGLHGEGFAYGYVVITEEGEEISSSVAGCDPRRALGRSGDLEWVLENVTSPHNCDDPKQVRHFFWQAWDMHRGWGTLLAADCLWPVEARFLAECVSDDPVTRYWAGPYPFIDIASVRLAAGLDPLGTNERLLQEEPAHNPLADARQSARLLVEALRAIKATAPKGNG